MGLALDESLENLEKLESNGIEAYIDPKLKEFLKQYGSINIDFVNMPSGSGFTIKAGSDDGACGTCGSKSDSCG